MREKIDVKKMAREINAELRKGSNPARREATLGYYPSALENMGVGMKHVRSVVRAARKKLRGQDPEMAVRVARAVVAHKTLEGRQLAYEIVAGHPGALDAIGIRDVEALGRGIDNWCSVDGFSCMVAGRAWQRGSIEDRDVLRWTRSKDRWWRRAALASTVPLNMKSRGGTGDVRRTLMVAGRLRGDRDVMVAKALSWALRSLVPIDRRAVEAFLKDHEAELPAIVKREVGNKLRTGLKNPKT